MRKEFARRAGAGVLGLFMLASAGCTNLAASFKYNYVKAQHSGRCEGNPITPPHEHEPLIPWLEIGPNNSYKPAGIGEWWNHQHENTLTRQNDGGHGYLKHGHALCAADVRVPYKDRPFFKEDPDAAPE